MNLLEVDLSLFQIQRKQNSRFKLNNTATHRILRIGWQYPVINKKRGNKMESNSGHGWDESDDNIDLELLRDWVVWSTNKKNNQQATIRR